MVSLHTTFMGLKLRNPIIVGSSGLTNSIESVVELEKQGAAAVVLKSLFEEQILHEVHHTMKQDELANQYPEALDYIGNYSRENAVANYLDLIRNCKAAVSIPVIASINCFTSDEWVSYARQIQDAGADALELNVFLLPSDPLRSSEKNEKQYFAILDSVLKQVKIPVALKISHYFSALAEIVRKLDWAGAKGLVLFNRFYSPDIDTETLRVIPSHVFSDPAENALPLRWIALLSGTVNCDLVATTGIHSGNDLIKMLLAGASAAEIVSVLYKKGITQIPHILKELEDWMEQHGFSSVSEFKGMLSYKKSENPAAYERVQFMKHFAGIE